MSSFSIYLSVSAKIPCSIQTVKVFLREWVADWLRMWQNFADFFYSYSIRSRIFAKQFGGFSVHEFVSTYYPSLMHVLRA
jgi:hypothetical protein